MTETTRLAIGARLAGSLVVLFGVDLVSQLVGRWAALQATSTVGAQVSGSSAAYYESTSLITLAQEVMPLGWLVALLVIGLIWRLPLKTFLHRARPAAAVVLLFGVMVSVSGCRPYQREQFSEVQPNETAFVIPLEGENTAGQAKFQSVQYLEARKVAAKRITTPTRWRALGRAPWDGEWIPTARVVKVDRTPVTREWTQEKSTGTTTRNETIIVESVESIAFAVDVTITTTIKEEDAATFLYWYAGKELADVVDSNIRSAVAAELSRRFGTMTLDDCRVKKGQIFTEVGDLMRKEFSERGVTILTFGNIGGLQYEDAKIQESINEQFKSENELNIARNKLEAQKIVNQQKLSVAETERKSAEEFSKAQEAAMALRRLDIQKIQAEKWNGVLPTYLFNSGTGNQGLGFLMNMDMGKDKGQRAEDK